MQQRSTGPRSSLLQRRSGKLARWCRPLALRCGLPLANSDRWKQRGANWFSGGATEVFVSSGRRLCDLVRGG